MGKDALDTSHLTLAGMCLRVADQAAAVRDGRPRAALTAVGLDPLALVPEMIAANEAAIVARIDRATTEGELREAESARAALLAPAARWRDLTRRAVEAARPTLHGPALHAAQDTIRHLRIDPRRVGALRGALRAALPPIADLVAHVPTLDERLAEGHDLLARLDAAEERVRQATTTRAAAPLETHRRALLARLRVVRRQWALAVRLSDGWLPALRLGEGEDEG